MKDGVDVNVVLGIRDGNIDIDGSDVGVIEGNTNIVGTDDGEDEGKSLGDIVEVLDGSCVCIKVGVEVGNFDGVDVVIALGWNVEIGVGISDGLLLGNREGLEIRFCEIEGGWEDNGVGNNDGILVDNNDGFEVGIPDGKTNTVGILLGTSLGLLLGTSLGILLGTSLGILLGTLLGILIGILLETLLGNSLGNSMVLYDGNFDIKLVGKLDGLVEFSTLLFPSATLKNLVLDFLWDNIFDWVVTASVYEVDSPHEASIIPNTRNRCGQKSSEENRFRCKA